MQDGCFDSFLQKRRLGLRVRSGNLLTIPYLILPLFMKGFNMSELMQNTVFELNLSLLPLSDYIDFFLNWMNDSQASVKKKAFSLLTMAITNVRIIIIVIITRSLINMQLQGQHPHH